MSYSYLRKYRNKNYEEWMVCDRRQKLFNSIKQLNQIASTSSEGGGKIREFYKKLIELDHRHLMGENTYNIVNNFERKIMVLLLKGRV